MEGDQDNLVLNLYNRVRQLMEKYNALKEQFNLLNSENEKLKRRISEKETSIETIEQQYKSARIASGVVVQDDDREEARMQINRIVREIDDCIALLNR